MIRMLQLEAHNGQLSRQNSVNFSTSKLRVEIFIFDIYQR